MKANAGRMSGGTLGTAARARWRRSHERAGGCDERLECGVTPESSNTSPEWSAGVNHALDTAVNFTDQSARDMYNATVGVATGADTNYGDSRMRNTLEQGWNDPAVDPRTRAIAQVSADVGQKSWDLAQTAAGGKAVINQLQKVPGAVSAARAYNSYVPQTVQKGVTYATGLPVSTAVNPYAALGSGAAQAGAAAFASACRRCQCRTGPADELRVVCTDGCRSAGA
jgi:hypothetical protein